MGSIDRLPLLSTTILWSGPSTPLLTSIVTEGRRRGITVTIEHRRNTLAQLHAATDLIWRQAAAGKWAGFKISGIGSVGLRDTGLIVYGTYDSLPAAHRAPQVKSLATKVSGVQVTLQPGTASHLSTGRDNDFAPFDAGGYMISTSSGRSCSSGFAINRAGSTNITTARHCSFNDYHARDVSANTYGTGVVNSSAGGGRVLSAHGAALALDGPWNSNNFTKTVIGYADLALNDVVCTGGGNSGEHCNIQVTDTSLSWSDGSGIITVMNGGQLTAGAIAQIQGDSGGPVISLKSTVSGQVRAAGMIQGFLGNGHTGSACGPVHDAGSNICTTNVLFSSMRLIVGGHLRGNAADRVTRHSARTGPVSVFRAETGPGRVRPLRQRAALHNSRQP